MYVCSSCGVERVKSEMCMCSSCGVERVKSEMCMCVVVVVLKGF